MSAKHLENLTLSAVAVKRLVSVMLLSVCLAGGAAQAAEWSFAPDFGVGFDADDNATLSTRTDEEEEITGGIASAGVAVGYRSDRYLGRIAPQLVWRRYPGDSDFDDDDQIVRFGGSRLMRNSELSLDGLFQRDYIRTGEQAEVEFDIEDPESIDDDDSGRVGARVRRVIWHLRPSWDFKLSDTSRARLSVQYKNYDYDDELVTRLVDFQSTFVRGRYSRRLSDRNTAIFEVGGFWYDADGGERFDDDGNIVQVADNDSFSYGFRAGIQRRLSETTNLLVLGGIGNSERAEGGSDANYLGQVGLTRRLATIRLLAQYQRRISGTGSGTLTTRDQINLTVTRQLSELLDASLGLVAYTTDSIEEDTNFDERTYVRLRSRFGWRLTRTLSLEANYRFALIDREDDDESANSNAVTLWLRYRPNPTTISR